MDIHDYLEKRRKLVDEALDRYLPGKDGRPEIIYEAVRYSVFSGGKRLRPILVLAASEAVGGDPEQALPFACAIEYIHTYSLIHDDLPAMDNDDLRRGKPTSHKVFGEAIAILAGDSLNTDAFSLIARETLQKGMDPEIGLLVIKEITDAAGLGGMVSGQVMDFQKEGQPCTPEELDYIHMRKTASLITASVRIGARIGNANDAQLAAMTEYGRAFGMAFQIADDILDVEGGEAYGKNTGRDMQRGKATYPGLHGLEASKKEAERLGKAACDALKGFDRKADPLRYLAEYAATRKY